MTLADLSIKRPIFITCTVIAMLVVGYLSLRKLGVDLFPNVTFPVVTVSTPYPGAGPREVETLVSKVLEDEISTVAGIKRLRSINKEGVSIVIAEFTLETDIKYAETQVRDKVSSAKRKLPKETKESIIRQVDPSDQPIITITVAADMPEAKLFDFADQVIRPKIEQIKNVGLVEVLGGRKREVRVELERKKLNAYEISATQVSQRILATGQNIPAGKVAENKIDLVFRTLGEFKSLSDIENVIVNFIGNDVPVRVGQVAKVVDSLEDETSRTFYNGNKALFLTVFRQSGANTIAVAEAVKKRVAEINLNFGKGVGSPSLVVVRDSSKPIRANVDDVTDSIFIGIFLTVLVVFFFLGSGRSTIITGLALPNSLLGAFILMAAAGFTVNVMTLLALSLAVGLLVDDAIVVRENIFRHIEMGKDPITASSVGTKEVTLAVIATTCSVIAVFGPIAFLKGVVGQFFKEFGLTICFAMLISLFDALTVAPMLSAYFAGKSHKISTTGWYGSTVGRSMVAFNRFQSWLETRYEKILKQSLKNPAVVFGITLIILIVSGFALKFTPKTFLGAQDYGEFSVGLDLPPGTSLGEMAEVAAKVDTLIRENKEVRSSVLMVGSRDLESNVATFFIELVSSKQRKVNTTQFKDVLREQLKPFSFANPTVKDVDMVGAGSRPFNVNIIGGDLAVVEKAADTVFKKLRGMSDLKDVETSVRSGKPEFQVVLDNRKAERMGISSSLVGAELRNQIEGSTPAVFREEGKEYDIRVRLAESDRNLKENFSSTFVPNINFRQIPLKNIASGVESTGPANILRQDRGRYVQIAGDLTPGGKGMGGVMSELNQFLQSGNVLPQGVTYAFVGQAENFKELIESMATAGLLAIVFIYLVLASLYESFVTPFTIMLVLPLAACGAFIALFLSGQSLDINSMIGVILLLGVATKNSILLVDTANQLIDEGMERSAALVKSGTMRLRPILMTTFALIAGMLPVAIGLNEASKQRTGMGIAIIGGLISSTLLSLVVVPASFTYIDRFRLWIKSKWVFLNPSTES
ncbi:MAG: efflux RND transporter permease subunit [Bdellovibrionales bacterium]|nr:efflux RND transporter permease subunit [Bdellovibrionales bacterium]